MMTLIYITIVLLVLAGIANAFMDRLKNWNNSIWKNTPKDTFWYKWAGPESWKRKWKLDKDGNPIPNNKKVIQYLYLFAPENKEWFWWSSTFLVMITDGWHFFQMIMWATIAMAAALHMPEIIVWNITMGYFKWFIVLSAARMVGFTPWYEWFLKKK